MTSNFVPINLGTARASLAVACDRLDDAVRHLAGADGDNVMASPGLIALLLNVVVARRQVRRLESIGTLSNCGDGEETMLETCFETDDRPK